VQGTLDKDDDEDQGYVVEARIPWSSFDKAKAAPPKPGDAWRLNLYAMQGNSGVGWSPILGQGNFHKASRIGRIRWVDEKSDAAAVTKGPEKLATVGVAATTPPTAEAKPAPGAPAKAGAGSDIMVQKKSLQQTPASAPPAREPTTAPASAPATPAPGE
jgi:hypothetical protein